MAQKNFKRLLRRRGSNSFQLSRMHLKGVCQEVDWLFPIWKTMTGRKKKKKLIGLLLFPWVVFLKGESFWSISYPVLLQPESRESPGQGADPQAGRGMSTFWNPCPGRSLSKLKCDNLQRTRTQGRSTSWNPQIRVGHPQDLQHDQLGRIKGL